MFASLQNNRRTFLIASIAAILIYSLLVLHFNWISDDAYISFRYSRNLAAGEGLRYNIGENPPVEGYSNFLWVLLMAPFEFIGLAPSIVARVVSFLCGLILLLRLIRFLSLALPIGGTIILAAAFFFATLPPVLLWTTSGLATMPFALVLFLVYEWLIANPYEKHGWLAGMACALLILLRAEGIAWAIVCIAIAAFTALAQKNRNAAKPIAICGALSFITLLAVVVFRAAYFHDILPNTVYAKATMTPTMFLRGFNYTISFFLHVPHLPLILIAAAMSAWKDRNIRFIVLHCVSFIAAAAAYSVLVGGDFMAMGRFFVLTMPFFAILFATAIRRVPRPAFAAPALTAAMVLLSLLALADVNVVPRGIIDRFHFRWTMRVENRRSEMQQWRFMVHNSESWARIGRAMKQHTREGESFISTAIGAVGYYSGLHIYDCCGLVDREVGRRKIKDIRVSPGHDKFVPINNFLKYNPTYIHASIQDRDGIEQMRYYLTRIGLKEYELRTHLLRPASSAGEEEYLCLFARERP
ncbi:MAG: hypothetical protein ABIA59_09730 [Candidatus Latescibacterota bacterium]